MFFPAVEGITPTEFERLVKRWLEGVAGSLEGFEARHQERVQGADGEYAIDVTAYFTALAGARFFLVCECKKYAHPIKREVVQSLNDKKRSLGAHKAFLVSTSPFQEGAKVYALAHGIALLQVARGNIAYAVNMPKELGFAIPSDADEYVGLLEWPTESGKIFPMIVTSRDNYWLKCYLEAAEGREFAP